MAVENNAGINVTFIFTVSVAASLKKGLLSSKTATDKRLLWTQLKCVFNPWHIQSVLGQGTETQNAPDAAVIVSLCAVGRKCLKAQNKGQCVWVSRFTVFILVPSSNIRGCLKVNSSVSNSVFTSDFYGTGSITSVWLIYCFELLFLL